MTKRKKCPICGTPIKIENLEKHMKRVHPKDKVDVTLSDEEESEIKRRNMKQKKYSEASNKSFYAIIAIIVVIAVVIGVLISLPSEESGETPAPKIQLGETRHDFGSVYNPDNLTYSFTFTNIGTGTLIISKIKSSCICTSATLAAGGDTSPSFTESPSYWSMDVKPGETATLTVNWNTLYFTEPQVGSYTRQIQVTTNDSSNPLLTFQVGATITR